jgi:hypothetical protein
LHDICYPDYWRGWGQAQQDRHGDIITVPLPFDGNGDDLIAEIDRQW